MKGLRSIVNKMRSRRLKNIRLKTVSSKVDFLINGNDIHK